MLNKPMIAMYCALGACLLAAPMTAADTLELNNGDIIDGTYVGGTKHSVRFSVDGKNRTIPIGDILAITFSGEQMAELDTFVQARLEEPKPPMVSAAREPGYRPSPEEDPLNAWMWKCRIEGAAEGLLAGKTVSYKDHIAVAGIPMSFGSFALEGFIPDFDATVVTRVLNEAGTIIGKNVMNGLSGGFGTGGGIGDYGRPLNPHNHDHVTGGSSAGSAAAVASGEVDISFGGDQGGSIRIPSAICGVVGIKPTYGRVSLRGVIPLSGSLDHAGPMARSVEDCAILLEAMAGYDPEDPSSIDLPVPSYRNSLRQSVNGLRAGVPRGEFFGALQHPLRLFARFLRVGTRRYEELPQRRIVFDAIVILVLGCSAEKYLLFV